MRLQHFGRLHARLFGSSGGTRERGMRRFHLALIHQHFAGGPQGACVVDQIAGVHVGTGQILQITQRTAAHAIEQFQIAHGAQLLGQIAQHVAHQLLCSIAPLFGHLLRLACLQPSSSEALASTTSSAAAACTLRRWRCERSQARRMA